MFNIVNEPSDKHRFSTACRSGNHTGKRMYPWHEMIGIVSVWNPKKTDYWFSKYNRVILQYYFDIWIWGVPINNPWKNIEGRQSSCPLGVSINGIGQDFNWLKYLGGFLHLKSRAGCQISTLIFDFFLWRVVGLYEYPMKNILRNAKFLTTWGFSQRYCPSL